MKVKKWYKYYGKHDFLVGYFTAQYIKILLCYVKKFKNLKCLITDTLILLIFHLNAFRFFSIFVSTFSFEHPIYFTLYMYPIQHIYTCIYEHRCYLKTTCLDSESFDPFSIIFLSSL